MAVEKGPAFFERIGSEPLAARMRPRSLDEFVGQEHIVGPGKLLRRAIEADQLSSIILWGPPGSGKTTLASIIAKRTQSQFLTINAVLAGVKEIREAIRAAQRYWEQHKRRTILFVDEVHRFNKAQQDALLPYVENGMIILIGATTENPYFEVIKPLVSRSRIFSLKRLSDEDIAEILRRALADPERGYGNRRIVITEEALRHLSGSAQGDARCALNALELAVETTPPGPDGVIRIDRDVAEESIQRRALLYDKDGDAHYDAISAFIKSLRGSDPDAALYWMARMLLAGEDPRFVARRMVIFASEDVGMADPRALLIATAAAHAVEYVGMPECQFNLAEACIYLATAPKSNSAMAYFDAVRTIEEEGVEEVPDHLKDPSRDRVGLGHGKGYRYPHAYRDHFVAQQYLPDKLAGKYFYHPSDQGYEVEVRERLASWRARQAQGLSASERAQLVTGEKEAFQRRMYGKERLQERDWLLRQVRLGESMVVLDACGNGLMAWGILAQVPLGRVVCLVDPRLRPAPARIQEQRVAERVDRILFPVLGRELCFCPRSFDAVLAYRPLTYGGDPVAFLREAKRVLIEGGVLAFCETLAARRRRLWQELPLEELPEDLAAKVIAAEEMLYRTGPLRYSLTEERLASLLKEVGFSLKSLDLKEAKEHISAGRAFVERLLKPASPGGPPSYGDRLRAHLTTEELKKVEDFLREHLQGRTLERGIVVAYIVAKS